MARTRTTFRPLIQEPPGNVPQHNPADGGYFHQEEDMEDAGSNSADNEPAGPTNSQENGDDQEPEAEGGHEEEDNSYGSWRDDHDPNNRRETLTGTSAEPSESERETWKREEENDDETFLDLLMASMDQMGLGEYKCLFKLHKVDDQDLQFLTVKDLKDMGVREVGSRLKICRCIRMFRK